MALSAKKAASNKKWDAANLDRISIALPKGQRDAIKAAAAAAGKSVNAYVIDAINARMSGAPAPAPSTEQPRKPPAPEQPAQKSHEQPKPEQRKPEDLDALLELQKQKLAEQATEIKQAQAEREAANAQKAEKLMEFCRQKCADLRQEEQLYKPGKPEQPKGPNPETLPPTRTIDYSPDAIPPDLLEKIERVHAARSEAVARENANSAEKNLPVSGANAEQR